MIIVGTLIRRIWRRGAVDAFRAICTPTLHSGRGGISAVSFSGSSGAGSIHRPAIMTTTVLMMPTKTRMAK